MIALAKSVAATLGADPTEVYQRLSAWSIRAALREQGLDGLADQLRRIVPDISRQYTRSFESGVGPDLDRGERRVALTHVHGP